MKRRHGRNRLTALDSPVRWLVAALVVAVAIGCGPEPALQRGTRLFSDPGFSPSPSNVFSCATCHTAGAGPSDGRKLPGAAMLDVASRPTFWGGAYPTLLEAVNECYVEFMRGSRLAPDQVDGRALLVYLESLSPDAAAQAVPLTVVKDIVTDPMMKGYVPDGDPTLGAAVYRDACGNCHGARDTGAGRLGPKVSILPKESVDQHGTCPTTGWRPITVEKVRHGKFFTVGGNMPLYSLEALSDVELGQVLSYLSASVPTLPCP